MSAEIAYDLGEPIRGPSALSGDWRRFWHLTFTIARTEFKLRFYGSIGGYFWQLVRPMLLFSVLFVVYSLGRLGTTPHYPAMLLAGVVMFTFFIEATSGAVSCVVDRENFVRKIQFPRLAIPLSVVLTAFFNLCINFVPVAIFSYIEGVRPHLDWLEIPLIIGLLVIFALGCAMLLSALFVRFRDVRPIWEVVCQVLFYASLILIPIERIAPHGKTLLHIWMLNPMADIMEQYRHVWIGVAPTTPWGGVSAATAIGGAARLAIPICFVLATFVVGFWVFNRSAPHIADDL
jgi:ABC-2 type transport system permease protein